MSLQSWKDEFYPIPANKVPEDQAIQHSLTKWRGLTPDNLERHDLCTDRGRFKIQEIDLKLDEDEISNDLHIDDGSCALCHHYADTKGDDEDSGDIIDSCYNCPLRSHLDASCDQDVSTPFTIWRNTGNPNPMIKALEATMSEELERGNG